MTSSLLTPRMRKLLEVAADELTVGRAMSYPVFLAQYQVTPEEALELATWLSLGARMVLEHL